MGGFWEILGLEPTCDISVIKRAYAQRTKNCHPEENPEGFLELRKAYQAAVSFAERGSEALEDAFGDWVILDEPDETGPNPFRDGEAIRQFMELYTGKQRKNPKLWINYFTSDAFLDVVGDIRFTALLSEQITEVEHEFPLNKELMMWFHIICQVFSGWETIAAKGPSPKRAGGDELAILESFKDYRHLTRMAEGGNWNEQAMEEFQWIINRYTSAYIKERCDANATPDYQRHPAGLRILTHFFQRDDLPEELYRMVWQKYDLKNVTMGRMKILYGPLRELVTKRLSGIAEETPENFFHLNQERSAFFAHLQANPDKEEEETAAFFAQKTVQNALRSRRFMEEQLLAGTNWLNSLTPECVIYWLQAFYQANQDIPGWHRVVERAKQELEYRIAEQNRKAEVEKAVPEELDLSLLLMMPKRVFAQSLTGVERLFKANIGRGNVLDDETWEEDAEKENAEPLTEECLRALFDQFAEGTLIKLQLQFNEVLLAFVHDSDKYACFCFEDGYDTWYSMLSKPKIYQTVDSSNVAYLTFGMGKLASYAIHESPTTIFQNLNLVFMQIGRERIRTRVGDCWIWASYTNRHNGAFKKRMAMQKLAKIFVNDNDGYILAKFVFSQYPTWVECVPLSGERTLIQLKPGTSDLAVAALTQFFGKKLEKLRLSWELQGQNGKTGGQHIVLLQDSGKFMMLWLQDDKKQTYVYASDTPRTFLGRIYSACLVHQNLHRIRNCFDLLMDDITDAELVINRPGEFVLADYPYAQVRKELVDETMM